MGVQEGAEKYFIVQAFSVSLIFPLGGWDSVKRPKGEIKANQEQQAQTVFLLEGYYCLVLGLSCVFRFFISNIWAREAMMCERHGRKSLTVRLKQ